MVGETAQGSVRNQIDHHRTRARARQGAADPEQDPEVERERHRARGRPEARQDDHRGMRGRELQALKDPRSSREAQGPQEEAATEKLGAKETTKFRALAARINYLAQDRADLQFVTKECCRCMSKFKCAIGVA